MTEDKEYVKDEEEIMLERDLERMKREHRKRHLRNKIAQESRRVYA